MQADHIADVAKLMPPAVVTVSSLAGFRWDTASYALASIYTVLMIGNFIWTKIIKPWRVSRTGGGDVGA